MPLPFIMNDILIKDDDENTITRPTLFLLLLVLSLPCSSGSHGRRGSREPRRRLRTIALPRTRETFQRPPRPRPRHPQKAFQVCLVLQA